MSGRVTALESSPRGKKLVDIYVDGELWRSTNRRAAFHAAVTVGADIGPAIVDNLAAEERKIAEESSLRLLGYRPRSISEIRTKLTASGVSPEAVEEQIARLIRAGYLNDADFARAWIDDRLRIRHYGRQRIKSELIAKGVDPEVFEADLEALCAEDNELTRAVWLLETKLPRRSSVDDAQGRRRAYHWLLRKGFSSSVARGAIQRSQRTGQTAPDEESRTSPTP